MPQGRDASFCVWRISWTWSDEVRRVVGRAEVLLSPPDHSTQGRGWECGCVTSGHAHLLCALTSSPAVWVYEAVCMHVTALSTMAASLPSHCHSHGSPGHWNAGLALRGRQLTSLSCLSILVSAVTPTHRPKPLPLASHSQSGSCASSPLPSLSFLLTSDHASASLLGLCHVRDLPVPHLLPHFLPKALSDSATHSDWSPAGGGIHCHPFPPERFVWEGVPFVPAAIAL